MRLTVLLLAVVLSSGCTATSDQSLRFLPDRMAHYHIPGLSLACIHNGAVERAQGFGVAKVGGEPV
jgi:hypothetical protein